MDTCIWLQQNSNSENDLYALRRKSMRVHVWKIFKLQYSIIHHSMHAHIWNLSLHHDAVVFSTSYISTQWQTYTHYAHTYLYIQHTQKCWINKQALTHISIYKYVYSCYLVHNNALQWMHTMACTSWARAL